MRISLFPLAMCLGLNVLAANTTAKHTLIKKAKPSKSKFNLPLILGLLGIGVFTCCKPITATIIFSAGLGITVGTFVGFHVNRILYNVVGYKFRPMAAKYISNPEEQYLASVMLMSALVNLLYFSCIFLFPLPVYPCTPCNQSYR